jgi:hypothetical protein
VSGRIGRGSLAAALSAVVACAVSAAACPASAGAQPYLPPGRHIFAGLTGGNSITAYERMVGKHPAVFEDYMTWDTPVRWIGAPDRSFRARLGIELSTQRGYAQPGVISPHAIARGGSDAFLVRLNRSLAHARRIFYIRLMGEMDGWWNAYAAYSASGAFRGRQNSPHNYIEAFRRTVLIVRGGPVARINRRLRALGLPPLHAGRTKALPRPRVAFLWVPQDAGSPEIAANSPAAFWPGAAYVDWVGTDFYSAYPNFAQLDRFYNQFAGKPFVISEWAVYGVDDPGFVHALFGWVRSHPRVRMLNYYQGFSPSSRVNLAQYPATQRALREELRPKVFLAYPPEYAHPPKHHKPERPPQPPQPGNPPSPPPKPCLLTVLGLCVP